MSLFKLVGIVPLYANYFLKAVDEHSLQAPFVYHYYTGLKEKLKKSNSHQDIEALRKKLLNDDSIIHVKDAGAGSIKNRKKRGKSIAGITQHEVSSWKKCAFFSALVEQGNFTYCIELGTSLGIATAYLSRACSDGRLVTFEADETLCRKSGEHLKLLGCENVHIIQGNIDDTLPPFLDKSPSLDFALVDANHTGSALEKYFHLLEHKIRPGGIIVIDDIRWSWDMYRTWKKILTHPSVTISLEFMQAGVLLLSSNHPRQHYILENPI